MGDIAVDSLEELKGPCIKTPGKSRLVVKYSAGHFIDTNSTMRPSENRSN